ncbi:MAG: DUF1581 domain-containing protein, partial [Planctomycetaceae bacterium]|nr:DUF1581 domain-containing protein [Planctomycetaceae bacterium]
MAQQYQRATFLFLVAAAEDDQGAAEQAFDVVIETALQLERDTAETLWPAVLMLRETLDKPVLRRMVSEFFYSVHFNIVQYVADRDLDVINDHMRELSGIIQQLDHVATEDFAAESRHPSWQPFSYSAYETRLVGRPAAIWRVGDGLLQKIGGHESDYLGFSTPLRGNYEVECDFTSTGGQQVTFQLGGKYLQPGIETNLVRIGNFRGETGAIRLERPLSKPENWSRYRATVRDNVITHFVNGRPVLTQELSQNSDPWFALRTWRRSQGEIRDLRITGSPQIPDTVPLTIDDGLNCWTPYFRGPLRVDGRWRCVTDVDGVTELHGLFHPDLQGTRMAELLQYYRPLFEDGVLEYEFFHEKGPCAVWPAVDTLALVGDQHGIQVYDVEQDEGFLHA